MTEQEDLEYRVKIGRITTNQARRELGYPEWDGVYPEKGLMNEELWRKANPPIDERLRAAVSSWDDEETDGAIPTPEEGPGTTQ
jgi:hypothetical protein